MTGGPADEEFERERAEAIRAEDERAHRYALHDAEQWTRKQPGQDRVHAACVREPGQPPRHAKMLWSTLARLRRDAAAADEGARIADLGACADDPARFREGSQTFIYWLKNAPEGHRCGS
jgi:hypothetical protein